MVKELKLSNSDKICLVDDEDFDRVNQHKWRLGETSVAESCSGGIYIHRFILNTGPINKEKTNIVDHIDRNILNNQKSNLRICDAHQSTFNRGPHKNAASTYKGITKLKDRWVASIRYYNKYIRIGAYKEEKHAAEAYDFYAKHIFKDFAYLNFPEKEYISYEECVNKNRDNITNKHSKYIGVTKNIHKNGNISWAAFSSINRRTTHIGTFGTEIEAAQARDEFVKKLKLKAKLNFPDSKNYIIEKHIKEIENLK